MNQDKALTSLWQSQTIDSRNFTFKQIQSDTLEFRRLIIRRNLQESCAAIMVALIFGVYAWFFSDFILRIGSGLVALNSLFILYHLRHKASVQTLPPESLALPYLAYLRQELMQQRDILRNVWKWCIPTLLGMGVILWSMAQPNPAEFPWQISTVIIVPFLLVFIMNYRTAQKLQMKIDQLDNLKETALG